MAEETSTPSTSALTETGAAITPSLARSRKETTTPVRFAPQGFSFRGRMNFENFGSLGDVIFQRVAGSLRGFRDTDGWNEAGQPLGPPRALPPLGFLRA